MNEQEAIKKASENIEAKDTNNPDPYAIPFECAETAKDLVGKTLTSKDPNNKNTIEIAKWIGQNYVLCINGNDYNATPVMWVISNISKFNVS